MKAIIYVKYLWDKKRKGDYQDQLQHRQLISFSEDSSYFINTIAIIVISWSSDQGAQVIVNM